MFKIPHTFGIGNDGDSSPLVVKGNIYALNCRIGTSGSNTVGCITNDKGNTLVSYNLPSGQNKCIGTAEDLENNAIIYCVANLNPSGGNQHLILRYNITSNTIDTILHQDLTNLNWQVDLNFDIDKFITSCFVIQGLLYWTGTDGIMRKINLEKSRRFTSSNGLDVLGYSVINEVVISRIKYPYTDSPVVSYQNDYTYNYNNIRGSTFQFAVAYVYDDNEISVQSPISKLPLPQSEEAITGVFTNNININNRLDIVFNSGEHTVKALLIIGRSNAIIDGTNPVTVSANNGSWYLIDRVEKYDTQGNVIIASNDPLYTYKFFNDGIKNIVDQADAARLFDYVPIKAGCEELIEKNRGLVGDITEGLDNVDIDVEILNSKVEFPIQQLPITNLSSNSVSNFPIGGTNTYYQFPASPQIGDVISFTMDIHELDSGGNLVYNKHLDLSYNVYDLTNYPQNAILYFYNAIISYVNAACNYVSPYTPPSYPHASWFDKLGIQTWFQVGIHYAVNVIATTYSYPQKRKTFKAGGKHQVGIIYYDGPNRSGSTNTSDKAIFYVPFFTEDNTMAGVTINNQMFYTQVLWRIKNIPPIDATHYQWAYTKCTSISEWIQFRIKYDNSATPPVKIYYDTNGNVRIPVNGAIVEYSTRYEKPVDVINTWIWQKGDRIRFILHDAQMSLPNIGFWVYYDNLHTSNPYYQSKMDFEIVGYDSTKMEFITEPFDITYFDEDHFSGLSYLSGVVVEIYRPEHYLGNRIFYEIGERFEIGNPGKTNRYHKGKTQDQDPSNPSLVPAQGIFDSGDCYMKIRATGFTGAFQYYPVEEKNLSDFYISDSCDIGRPNVVDRNQKQRHLQANYRWSGQLVQDTQINNMSRFYFLDSGQLPDKFGTIRRFVEVADVVKAIMDKKTISIYVGRSSTGEADQTNNLYVTSGVLGTVVIPAEEHGTIHPESVHKHDRHLYFFDQNEGEFCRDSANGTFAISSYGQTNYFRTWSEQMKYAISQNGKTSCVTNYDKQQEYVVVTIHWEYNEIVNPGNPQSEVIIPHGRTETVAFLDKQNETPGEMEDQWKTELSFIPEYYGSSGTTLISFVNGGLWLHHSNIIRNNFYGTKYPQRVTFAINTEPDTIKRFLALAYNSNKKWGAPIITIPPCEQYPQGMQSRLKDIKFRIKEGYYYSEFLQDMLTPNMPAGVSALTNGRDLIGRVIIITLENFHDDEVWLYDAYVNVNKSELSGLK